MIGQAYADVLSKAQQEALHAASITLIDGFFDDIESLASDPAAFRHTCMSAFLPPRCLPKYTALFAREFTVCLIVVTWKLAQAEPARLSCLAEELAASALIKEAEGILRDEKGVKDADFGAFEDALFEDTDFEYLFTAGADGIDASEVGVQLGMASLGFDEWFTPYTASRGAVHPYLEESAETGED